MAFEWYSLHHYQFGVDVIQNVGPYGFLQYPAEYSGLLPYRKVLFSAALAILVGLLAHRALRYFEKPGKVLWIACLFLMPVPIGFAIDPVLYLVMVLAAHHLVTRRTHGDAWVISGIVWIFMALLCLMKATNLAIAGLLICVPTICNVLDRRYRFIAFDLLCFFASLIAFWMLADQRLANFPRYVHDTFLFTSGYNEAMWFSIDLDTALVCLAVGVMALFAYVNILRLRRAPRDLFRLLLAIYEAGCVFIVWKHGYVRADYFHVEYFWCFMLPGSVLMLLGNSSSDPTEAPKPIRRRLFSPDRFSDRQKRLASTVITACLCYIAFSLGGPNIPWPGEQIENNVLFGLHWNQRIANLDASVNRHKTFAALPEVKRAVGDATIDDFGKIPSVILLNDLNYHPRPMAITFAAYNQAIQQRNAEFYRNPQTAPRFVYISPASIDQRFYAQDDSLALLQLLAHYKFDFQGPLHDYVLLERRYTIEPVVQLTPIVTQTTSWNTWIDVPRQRGKGLWCIVHIKPTIAGQLRSFLYKPSPVMIELAANEWKDASYRFLTGEGPTGFLIDPLILQETDLLPCYGIAPDPALHTPPIDKIRFLKDGNWWFKSDLEVTFSTVDIHASPPKPEPAH